MPVVLRFGAAAAATIILLVPAIWNGFPLLEYDSGGYMARWFEGTLVISRSTVYGLFVLALTHPDLWPLVIAQAAATVWVLSLVLRSLQFDGRSWMLIAVTALLSALTTLPWIASVVLTDIFAGLAVLALYLLVFAPDRLRRWERRGLFMLLAFAVATHNATLAVVAGALAWRIWRVGAIAGIAQGAGAVALGALLLVSANFVVSGRIAWTPGGLALPFGRMLQDGIVARYLADHCPQQRYKLCAHRHELPTDADSFFWSDDKSVFNRLGRFRGLGDEMDAIVLGALRDYPAWQIGAAARAMARQLVSVASGEGVEDMVWHTYGVIERYEPSLVANMRAARQQQGELDFATFNQVHVPVALISMVLLIPLMAAGLRHARYADLAAFATTVAAALLANAFVCGVLANPHDRYGARMVWLAPLLMLLAAWRLGQRRQRAAAADYRLAGITPKAAAP